MTPIFRLLRHDETFVMISSVTALHTVWALLLMGSAEPLKTAPMSALAILPRGLAIAALCVSVAGAVGSAMTRAEHRLTRFACLWPQTGIMLMTGWMSVVLVWEQRYADGVLRPWPFMLADQAAIIALAIGYCVAVVVSCKQQRAG